MTICNHNGVCQILIDEATGSCGIHLIKIDAWDKRIEKITELSGSNYLPLLRFNIARFGETGNVMYLEYIRKNIDNISAAFPHCNVFGKMPFFGIDKFLAQAGYPHVKQKYFHTHEAFGGAVKYAKQVSEVACGIACVATLVQRLRNQEFDEVILASYFMALNHANSNDPNDKSKKLAFDTDKGVNTAHIIVVLNKMCIPLTRFSTDDPKKFFSEIEKATPAKPMIAHLQKGAGGHYVVVDGMLRGEAVVCDPAHGLVMHAKEKGFNYPHGRFTGLLLQT